MQLQTCSWRDRGMVTGSEGLEGLASASCPFPSGFHSGQGKRAALTCSELPRKHPGRNKTHEGPSAQPRATLRSATLEQNQQVALGWPHPEQTLRPNQPYLCVETGSFHHCSRSLFQSLPADRGQVFCGNSFQHTQVQRPLSKHTNGLRHV